MRKEKYTKEETYNHERNLKISIRVSCALSDEKVLVQRDGSRVPMEGFLNGDAKSRNAFLNGIMGFSYTGRDKAGNDVNITLFANSLTKNVHQRDEFSFISNALFAGFLTETPYAAADDLNLPTGQ